MERTEWPSAERLAELRDQGKVALSNRAVSCAAGAAVLLSIFVMRERFEEIFFCYSQILAGGGEGKQLELLSSSTILTQFVVLILVPPLSALGAALFVGLLQSKLLIKFDLLGFKMQRLNPWGSERQNASSALFRIVSALALELAIASIALFVAYLVCPTIFSVLSHGAETRLSAVADSAGRISGAVVAFLVIWGFASWLAVRFSFLMRHRMTRREVESQASER